MVMAMRRCRQALRARDNELKGRDGATRVFASDQEAYRERPETDGLVGRIDVEEFAPRIGLVSGWSDFLGNLGRPSEEPLKPG